MFLPVLSTSSLLLGCPIIRIPSGNNVKIHVVLFLKGLHQNLHIQKVQSEPRVHPQNLPMIWLVLHPEMSYRATATTGLPLFLSGMKPKKLSELQKYFGIQKICSHDWTTLLDHHLKIKEIQALLFWKKPPFVPLHDLHVVGCYGWKVPSWRALH